MEVLVFLAIGSALAVAICWKYKYFNFQVYDEEMPSTDNSITEIPIVPTPAEKLYAEAVKAWKSGLDPSPQDLANDEVGCCESVENVRKNAHGAFISGTDKPILHTKELELKLRSHIDFTEVFAPELGAIIVSPTGDGNGKVRGHVGICGKTHILSNNSANGRFEPSYTYKEWDKRYAQLGGIPTYYFKPK